MRSILFAIACALVFVGTASADDVSYVLRTPGVT